MKSSKLETLATIKLKCKPLKVRLHPRRPELCVLSYRNDSATILTLEKGELIVTRTHGSGKSVRNDEDSRYLGACYSPSGDMLGLVGIGRAIELRRGDECRTLGFAETDPQARIERESRKYLGLINEAEMTAHIRRIFAAPRPETYTGVCFSADGKRVMATGHSRGTLLFSLPEGELLAQFGGRPELADSVLHPEGRLVAHIENLWGDCSGEIFWGHLDDDGMHRRLGRVHSLGFGPHGGCFSPDGRTLVVVGNEDALHYAAIDVASGEFLHEWADGVSRVKDPPDEPFFYPFPERVVFHPDSSRFLLPFAGGALLEIDTRTGEPAGKYKAAAGIVSCDACYSRSLLAVACERGDVIVFRLPYEGEPPGRHDLKITRAVLDAARFVETDADNLDLDVIDNEVGLKFIEKI